MENRLRADCPRPAFRKIMGDSESFVGVMLKEKETRQHKAVIGHLSIHTIHSHQPSATVSRHPLRSPGGLASEPRVSTPPLHQIQQAGRRICAWLQGVRIGLRSLAMTAWIGSLKFIQFGVRWFSDVLGVRCDVQKAKTLTPLALHQAETRILLFQHRAWNLLSPSRDFPKVHHTSDFSGWLVWHMYHMDE